MDFTSFAVSGDLLWDYEYFLRRGLGSTVCLRGGDQKKFLFWVNQWFYLVSLVQKIGDPSGAHQFLAFLPIFMAKNCPNLP